MTEKDLFLKYFDPVNTWVFLYDGVKHNQNNLSNSLRQNDGYFEIGSNTFINMLSNLKYRNKLKADLIDEYYLMGAKGTNNFLTEKIPEHMYSVSSFGIFNIKNKSKKNISYFVQFIKDENDEDFNRHLLIENISLDLDPNNPSSFSFTMERRLTGQTIANNLKSNPSSLNTDINILKNAVSYSRREGLYGTLCSSIFRPSFYEIAQEYNVRSSVIPKKNTTLMRPGIGIREKPMTDLLFESGEKLTSSIYDVIEKLICKYNIQIKTLAEKGCINRIPYIYQICRLIAKIERLHPYQDLNCRTICSILLNSELLYLGMYPAIQSNPNHFDFLTTDRLCFEVLLGQIRTKYFYIMQKKKQLSHLIFQFYDYYEEETVYSNLDYDNVGLKFKLNKYNYSHNLFDLEPINNSIVFNEDLSLTLLQIPNIVLRKNKIQNTTTAFEDKRICKLFNTKMKSIAINNSNPSSYEDVFSFFRQNVLLPILEENGLP